MFTKKTPLEKNLHFTKSGIYNNLWTIHILPFFGMICEPTFYHPHFYHGKDQASTTSMFVAHSEPWPSFWVFNGRFWGVRPPPLRTAQMHLLATWITPRCWLVGWLVGVGRLGLVVMKMSNMTCLLFFSCCSCFDFLVTCQSYWI